jgi:hypothetical protein
MHSAVCVCTPLVASMTSNIVSTMAAPPMMTAAQDALPA